MSKIVELPESLANQIAAGEVVERPASVVKELVENALDAGSNQITVNVEESGLKSIEVIDNGEGIAADDLPRALLRHATSKIKNASDLFRIRTLGFRGEALPSIVSVSQLTIETSVADEAAGTRLFVKAGEIERLEPAAKRQGTRVLVENLFFNTPARLKYVKSLQAELAHITDIINRLSLAHPEVRFTLKNAGNILLATSGAGELRQTVAQVYGMQTARKMVAVSSSDLDFQLTGFVSLPELTRASRNYISIFLNGRYIKNFLLNRAIIEGYGSKLMVGRFPLVVLHLTVDPQLTDVNVHPTKQEMRLSKERELMELITSAIRSALGEETLIPHALENLPERQMKEELPVQTEFALQEEAPIYETPAAELTKNATAAGWLTAASNTSDWLTDIENTELSTDEKRDSFPDLQFLSQLHLTYLLCESADGLYIVDQHAAQERVKYEQMRDSVGDVSYAQQQLLVPLVIELPKNDFLRVESQLTKLEEAGIFLAAYGESSFVLREHPVWMCDSEVESATYEMIDLLLADREVSVKKYREDLAIMIACKSSIKANMPLDADGARDLLKQLAVCENPYNCPHGRPAVVKFTSTEIEKMFRRIQASHHSGRLSALES